MKTVYSTLGFAFGASAALIPRDQCCFSLTAAGGKTGTVGQLGDGQNRIGQTGGLANQQGTYCLNNGGLTDSNGRGCILTPPTTQFQCDVGASPTTGFSVNSNGDLTYNGNTQFYACATGDNGGYNIYTTTTDAQSGCVKVTLNTGGKCSGNGGSGSSSAPASSAPPASQPASSAPPASQPASSAPPASQPASSAPPASQPASGPASQGTPCATQLFDGCNPARSSCPNGPGTFTTVTPSTYPTSYVINGQTVSITAQPSSCLASATGSGSQPAGSQPATSQPPAGPQTQTVYSTYYSTVISCGPEVSNCPAGSTQIKTTVVPTAPASQPAGSSPAASQPPTSQPAGSKPASSAASQPPASQPAASKPASSAPAPSGTSNGNNGGKACQTSLTGAYETPHAIIPVNKDQPSKSYGTQYNAYISSSNSTIFNFDIPQSYSGKQCSVIFLFPKKSDLETSSFTQSGSGGIKFDQLSSAAPLSVSYSNMPAVKNTLGSVDNVTPGNSYVVSTGSCQAGSTVSIEASSTGGLGLEFFEDWNPSPIGVFITSC